MMVMEAKLKSTKIQLLLGMYNNKMVVKNSDL